MRSRSVAMALLLSGLSACKGACGGESRSNDDAESVAIVVPKIQLTELARANSRFEALRIGGGFVYTHAMQQGWRRVPIGGGPLENVAGEPSVPDDRTRAYRGGYGPEPGATGDEGGEHFVFSDGSIDRIEGDGGRTSIATTFSTHDGRKVMIVDGDRLYWIEPAAEAVLSVPRHGGEVTYVCEARVPLEDDIAIVGDRLYLLGIGGDFHSAAKAGSAPIYHGNITSELGPNRNGIWMTASEGTLYVVSDATESMSMPVVEIGKPLPPAPDPVFDSRIVKIVPPTEGQTFPAPQGGLLFARSIELADVDRSETHALLEQSFAPFADEIRKGRVPVTLSIGTTKTDPIVAAAVGKIEAWVRSTYGAAAAIDRTAAESAPDASLVASSIDVGIARSVVPRLFAPPAPSSAPAAKTPQPKRK